MALTRASRSTPPNIRHCLFEYFCKKNKKYPQPTESPLIWPIVCKSQPFLQLSLLLRSFARFIEPSIFFKSTLSQES